jgi:hypothetical protein
VRTDPENKQHEITVTSGGADLKRGGELIQLTQFDRVSFPTGGPTQRAKVLAPPTPLRPLNLQPLIVENPRQSAVRFEWQPVEGAISYTLRIAASSTFKSVLAERRLASTSAEISGLDAGDYFWTVAAIDSQRRVSEPSETFKFTLAAQGKGQEMLLEVEGTQVHGSSVEVYGRTEPGATLLINGQPVTDIKGDGRFHYFSPPLSRGSQTIVITGQNRRGGTAIKRVQIVIP